MGLNGKTPAEAANLPLQLGENKLQRKNRYMLMITDSWGPLFLQPLEGYPELTTITKMVIARNSE